MKEFQNKMAEQVKKFLNAGEELVPMCVPKNNDTIAYGFSLHYTDKKLRMVPVIYLNSFYGRYKMGESLLSLAEELYMMLKNESFQNTLPGTDFNTADIMDYEKIKELICFQLVNTDSNRQMLSDKPYRTILDMSLLYFCLVPCHNGMMTLMISMEHMALWKRTEEDLYRQAMINTPRLLPAETEEIFSMLNHLAGKEFVESVFEDSDEISKLDDSMIVATNTKHKIGAAVMLYPDFLYKMKESYGDFYICPSSIHEIIILPKDKMPGSCNAESLKRIVAEVNRIVVQEEEVLSDSVYFYNGTLQMVSEN